jgi:hypothetical protein
MTKQHIFIIENNIQKVGQSFFHLSSRTTVIQDLLVRRQFSLVQDNRTNVNVEAWCPTLKWPSLEKIFYFYTMWFNERKNRFDTIICVLVGNRTKAPWTIVALGQKPPWQKAPNNEIIIQSYYICFILMVILKDIFRN